MRNSAIAPLILTALLAWGCNAPAPSPTASASPAAAASASPSATPGDAAPEMAQPPEGAKVWFANLKDGDKVKSPVKVEMLVEGMEVKPAGTNEPNTGHHHLIIDGVASEFGVAVPADETHIHFGQGQTDTEIELAPGEHTLTLQFADLAHRSYGPQMSATIKITVEE